MTLKVNITTEDGELLEHFVVLPVDGDASKIVIAAMIRDLIETKFSTFDPSL